MKQTLGPRIFGGVINEALDLGRRRRGCGLCRGVQNYGDRKVCLLAWRDDAWPGLSEGGRENWQGRGEGRQI